MRKDAVAIEHVPIAHGREANRLHAMEQRFPKLQRVGVRRRRAAVFLVHVTGIVHQTAQAGMGFEPLAARQVNGLGRDVVNRRSSLLLRLDAEVLNRSERRQPWPGQWQLRPEFLDLEF